MAHVQRDTPILAQLCTLLVQDQYGELAARVFSVLARYGRQTLAAVVRASYLNTKQIKHGLVVLIQQHLIFHSHPVDPALTHYEIDWRQSYGLVRYGKILSAVEERFGERSANVMANLLTLGHTRVQDLREAYFPPTQSDNVDNPDEGEINGPARKKARTNGSVVNGVSSAVDEHVTVVSSGLGNSEIESGTMVNGDRPTNGEVQVNGNGHAKGETLANGDHLSANNISKSAELARTNGVKKRVRPSDDTDENQMDNKEISDKDIQSVVELDAIIHNLMRHGWIIKVEDSQYLSAGDLQDFVRQEAIHEELDGRNPTGTKEKDRLTVAVAQRKRATRDGWCTPPKFKTRKLQASDPEFHRPNKRLKMDNDWSSRDEVVVLDDLLIIRVNPEKAAVAMRTEQLAGLIGHRLGSVPAEIYRTMLRILEINHPRCYEEWPDPPCAASEEMGDAPIEPRFMVTARDVAKKLSRHVDVLEGLDPHSVIQVATDSVVDSKGCLDPPVDPFQLSLDDKTRIVDMHLRKMMDDPFHFVTWHSQAGFSQWRIEFEELAKVSIEQEIENTILARGNPRGKLGVKLIRALRRKGKLDERQMCIAMMMPAADIRHIANEMTVQGFVQTQELAKLERREAKHSLFMIWYDQQRAREKLLHDTYKGMIRILQRIEFEREKVQDLLRKAERSDVVGNEAKWLSPGELAALKKWKAVQNKLFLQLFREDDLVATLRDFIGPLPSV